MRGVTIIIQIGSQKGGVGKSTIALNVAISLAVRGKDVCLVDADKQGTSSRCAQVRSETNLPKIHTVSVFDKIHTTLKDLNQRYEYVLVDVSGRDSLELRSGMLVADLLVAPFRPSKADLETLGHLNRVVSEAKMINEKLVCMGVLSMTPTNPIIKERQIAEEYFKDYPEFTMFDTAIHDRKVYRDCMSEGWGVVESNNLKAKREMNKFVEEILCL